MGIDYLNQQDEVNSRFIDPTKKVENKEQEQFATYDELIKSMETDLRTKRLSNNEVNNLNKFQLEHPDGQILFCRGNIQPLVGIESNPNLYGEKKNPDIYTRVPEYQGGSEERSQYDQKIKPYRIEAVSGNDETKFAVEAMKRIVKMTEDLSSLEIITKENIAELKKVMQECIDKDENVTNFAKKVEGIFADQKIKKAEVMYANLREAEILGLIAQGKTLDMLKEKLQ